MHFSLRSLIVVLSVTCFYLALVFAAPVPAGLLILALLTLLLPALAVGGVIYSRGDARAFWIGCVTSGVIPHLVAIYVSSTVVVMLFDMGAFVQEDVDDERYFTSIIIAICHALTFVNGLLVVATKRLHQPAAPPRRLRRSNSSTLSFRRGFDGQEAPFPARRPDLW